MSTYDYRCKNCGHEWELVEPIGEHERQPKPPCPKCHSEDVEQVPMHFEARTSKKG